MNSSLRRAVSAGGRILISVLVWGLFVSACAEPAAHIDEGGHACTAIRLGSPPGLVALLLGWVPPFSVPWSANLLLLVGWVFLVRGRFPTAAWLGGVGAALALTTWGYGFPELMAGYYLWQSSLVVLAGGAVLLGLLCRAPQGRAGAPDGEAVPTAVVMAAGAAEALQP
jgi:hypothetical protein